MFLDILGRTILQHWIRMQTNVLKCGMLQLQKCNRRFSLTCWQCSTAWVCWPERWVDLVSNITGLQSLALIRGNVWFSVYVLRWYRLISSFLAMSLWHLGHAVLWCVQLSLVLGECHVLGNLIVNLVYDFHWVLLQCLADLIFYLHPMYRINPGYLPRLQNWSASVNESLQGSSDLHYKCTIA